MCLCSGYRIAFDGAGFQSSDNGFDRNVIIFVVDNSLSSHSDNLKNNFLVLAEGPTDNIDGSNNIAEKMLSINFSKAKTKFCLTLDYHGNNSYLLINGKVIYI